eukprot:3151915-Prymnesium_polylepis.1
MSAAEYVAFRPVGLCAVCAGWIRPRMSLIAWHLPPIAITGHVAFPPRRLEPSWTLARPSCCLAHCTSTPVLETALVSQRSEGLKRVEKKWAGGNICAQPQRHVSEPALRGRTSGARGEVQRAL